MHLTRLCSRMVTTHRGLRRILKDRGPVTDYIRKAVQTGVYRTAEEIEEYEKDIKDLHGRELQTAVTRFRQEIVRGSYVEDYPQEYLILQQHPPVPDNPRTPKRLLRKVKKAPNPMDRLVRKYLDKYEGRQMSAPNGPATTEEYYRRLLGVPSPNSLTALGRKSAIVQKAYAAAIKNYELQRTEGLSEAEAMQQVDALLAQQDENEMMVSRQLANKAKEYGKTHKVRLGRTKKSWEESDDPEEALGEFEYTKGTEHKSPEAEAALNDLEHIFSAKPRTLEAMMRWSEKLAAVPYEHWTVGASTALDHWIARQLLGISEETWQALLEGDDPSLLSRGRDIVAVREAVFPETVFDSQDDGYHETEDGVDGKNKSMNSSIDDLLLALRGSNAKDEWNFREDVRAENHDEMDEMVNELQSWRRKNQQRPFEQWLESDKDKFNAWLQRYISLLITDSDRGNVDFTATRNAILSQPPVDREDSDHFWNLTQDEAEAAVLLDEITRHGPPPGASILHAAFWDLPRNVQLERLVNLGAVRPLMDEYAKESDRLRFLQRYGDALLSGVMLEHLVRDPEGPVTAEQLGTVARALGVLKDERFRLEVLPYKSAGDLSAQEKSRALYNAWNYHKAGRARYEEYLFLTDRLGLEYTSDMLDESGDASTRDYTQRQSILDDIDEEVSPYDQDDDYD